jgi:hypothetical protein
MDGVHHHGFDRDTHLHRPDFMLCLDLGSMLEVRVPANITERRLGEVDLQVNPLIVRCDFELVIVEKTLRLRIDKCFHHVTIPEFPTLFGGVFACVNVQRLISAPIGEVYIIRGPETCAYSAEGGQ